MSEESKSGMQCLEFDALLSEAIDGTLSGAELEQFETHRKSCASCGPMFAEAQHGMHLLRGLAEVEPPANFVHNILTATIGRTETAVQTERPRESWWQKLRSGLRPVLGPVLQPKFAMSFAMAFFSISLVLSLAGVKLGNVRHLDLSPNAIMRGAYEAQARVVKYYENIRFVYEIESRVQELKRATTPEESNPPAEREKDRKDRSDKPDRKYQNYSREQEAVTMARLFDSPPLADQVFARRNS
ncbi:MAG: zf-HC2 domain-containing protein [Acidobacteriia bacterium]|nr:zf-HC2 domain-containing protein [Terriglobia bacterium]